MSFKLTDSSRLLAIDPSLTASGWALFSLKGGKLLGAGVLRPPGPGVFLADRLASLQTSVEQLMEQYKLGSRDLLVAEGPAPLVLNPQSALKVERVRSIFEAVARSRSLLVPGRVNPRSVQTELMGMRGKQLDRVTVKTWARESANRIFGTELYQAVETAQHKLDTAAGDGRPAAPIRRLPQDIIDAALVGFYAIARLRLATQAGLEISCAFQPRMGRGTKASSVTELHNRPAVPSALSASTSRRSAAARIGGRSAPVRPGAGRSTATHPASAGSMLHRRGAADGILERRTRRGIIWTEADLDRILKRR